MQRETSSYDVAVVGAGVFGAWTALQLGRASRSVILLDAYGAGNSRASSGGETRVLRLGYGPDALYTRWARRSFELWRAFERSAGLTLFQRTGVLWLAHTDDPLTTATLETLREADVAHQRLDRADMARRYPQMAFDDVTWGLLEPESGVLRARQAVQAVVRALQREGGAYRVAGVLPPGGGGTLDMIRTRADERIAARLFVFACGPWLSKLFPDLLGARIFPTRQEVFFFGPPPGDGRFAPPALPAWIDFRDGLYGVPDVDGRGVKIAVDRHGSPFDPDNGDRLVPADSIETMRHVLAARFPGLAGAPLVETRVCQYENTSTGDFLIDVHPGFDNVWLVGGGSGHGFKHGPALGEYVAARVAGNAKPEARFALAAKGTIQRRAVF